MSIEIIAAIGRKREIGENGKTPWDLSEDRKKFKEVTEYHAVIMGRKTFESIGQALPKRLNIILSRNPNFTAPEGSLKADSLEEAIKLIPDVMKTFIIGGAEVYAEALCIADKMHITFVDTDIPNADAYFPSWNVGDWKVAEVASRPPTKERPLNSTYVVYERRK